MRARNVVFILLLTGCRTAPTPVDLIVFAPRMLDVRSGETLTDRAVIIRDGRITAVEEGSFAHRLAAKQRLTQPAETTMLPGLID